MAVKKDSKLEVTEKYTYNEDSDVYIVNLKCAAKPFVVPGYRHREIIKALSGAIATPMTVNELAMRLKIPQDYLEEYKKIFGLTRDSLPLSDEEVAENSEEFSADRLLEMKKFQIFQAFEKQDWKETQKDAISWREFQAGQLDPFRSCLESWVPPEIKYQPPKGKEKATGKVLVIGLADLHFGMEAKARSMYGREGWNTVKTVEGVKKYCDKIIEYNNTKNFIYEKIIILYLGDAIHSLNGKTSRGTDLRYDCIKEEQFEYALDSLSQFIGNIASVIPNVEFHSTCGNHNYEAEMALVRALAKSFEPNKKIKFFNYESRPASFRDSSTLIILDHGQSDDVRAYVPINSDNKLQLHVQDILLKKPEMLIGAKSKLFVMGDKHSFQDIEYNNFEFIMFGCMHGGNDEYANEINVDSRPRQTCLTLDKDSGLEEIFHVYFD
jgi:hypothetical protein